MPMDSNFKFQNSNSGKNFEIPRCQEIGCLMHALLERRPDFSISLKIASRILR